MSDLSSPELIMKRLEEIDADLANRQNALEASARAWFIAKRDREKNIATEFLKAEGTVAERNAIANRLHCTDGAEHEAAYEALKAVCRVLETRVGIGQSLLRAHGRAGS